jgi:hypothetical protein
VSALPLRPLGNCHFRQVRDDGPGSTIAQVKDFVGAFTMEQSLQDNSTKVASFSPLLSRQFRWLSVPSHSIPSRGQP